MSSTRANPLFIEEILVEIFDFLLLDDLKNAALVCKSWFRVCNRRRFTEEQAFFVPNTYDYDTIVHVLYNCEKESLNLKFDQSLIDGDSWNLWETCGRRIESLHFSKCIFQNLIIPEIFENCRNLSEFTLRDGRFLHDDHKFYVHPPRLNYLVSNHPVLPVASVLLPPFKMVRKRLTLLNLDTRFLKLCSSDLQTLASAFPGLRSVKINMLMDDIEEPEYGSLESPNLFTLFELLATKLKKIDILEVQFPMIHGASQLLLNYLIFNRQNHPPCDFHSSATHISDFSIKPYFEFSEKLRPIQHAKFCSSILINTRNQVRFTDDRSLGELIVMNNPLLRKLEALITTFDELETTYIFFLALIVSDLNFLSLHVYNFPNGFVEELEERINAGRGLSGVNETVRRLKIHSHVDKFSELCLKYFKKVKHLSIRPVNPKAVFKYQKYLRNLSIAPVDKPFIPPSSVISVKKLEVLKIRGSILSFLSGYQFPDLKYLLFTYFPKTENDEYYMEIEGEPTEEMLDELLPLFGLDVDERDVQKWRSQDFNLRKSNCAKLFLLKLNRLSSVLAAKAPNLEGLSINFKTSNLLSARDYSLFFQLCQKFPKLRYVSVRSKNEDVKEAVIKSEMLKYMSQCPLLRAVWYETKGCRICLHYNVITRKLEFSDQYSKRNVTACFKGVNLKNFYYNER